MRFIHTSDWHLGKPFGRAPDEARAALQETRLGAIDSLARAAQVHDAPLVLVAGDVFDSAEPGDRVYRQALSRMRQAANVTFVLLPGNHDPLRADGLWTRLKAETPPNVIAAVEPGLLPIGKDAVILPAPITHKRSLSDPTADLMLMETQPGLIRIGLAHGAIKAFATHSDTNLIVLDRAEKAGLAYLALGDRHGRLKVGPRTFYSGAPEPDDFGHEAIGLALLVELAGPGAPPQVTDLAIGRHHWIEADWNLAAASDLDALTAGLAPAIARQDVVARLHVSGLLSLGDKVAVRRRLEDGLAHELRWLDLDLGGLVTRPTDTDLAEIDAFGDLRAAAERLNAMAAEGGAEGRLAAAALERLYVEHHRAQRPGEA
ncbi:DNA repair exonuclease [Xanthobacter sp. V7C-4]|uniref:metallophosphoesterase family protein n=1 Tax=Xanthobacter autotrophicus (strain ATCC BAA-1158 / Py2) TaxID=78245 RepID=UPI003727A484